MGAEGCRKENRICLCMYVEVLTLQFGGGGHPVSARSGAIYQRELSQEDTAGALPRRDRTSVDGGQPEVTAIFDSAPAQAFVNHCTPPAPPQPSDANTVSDQHFLRYQRTAREQLSNSDLISRCAITGGGGEEEGAESFRPNLRSAVFCFFFFFFVKFTRNRWRTNNCEGSSRQYLFHRTT